MAEWIVQDLETRSGFAKFYLSAIGQLSGIPRAEYLVIVNLDGTWNIRKEKGGWWRECNGVIEELEPLMFATIRKAQALLILKG